MPGFPEAALARATLLVLGHEAFPPTPRVVKVCRRLALLPDGHEPAALTQLIQGMVPKQGMFEFHWLLSEHAKNTCLPEAPSCGACGFRSDCRTGRRAAAGQARAKKKEGFAEMKLKFGIPIGNLQEATLEMMRRAGFNVTVRPRSYYPEIDDPEIEARLLRPQDMSRFVEKGVVDCGLTGNDWVAENRSRVHVVTELTYSKQSLTPFRWVIAVPENSPIRSREGPAGQAHLDRAGQRGLASSSARPGSRPRSSFRTARRNPRRRTWWTRSWTARRPARACARTRCGSSRPCWSRGRSSSPADAAWADPWKREKMESIAILLQGALAARFKVGLKMNVSAENLDAVLKALPAMKKPTMSGLASGAGFALETIVDESVVRKIIPDLRRAGAEAIVEYPLNKVIP